MIIKWTGKDTRGIWKRKAEASSMLELYNILVNMGVVSSEAYEIAQIKKDVDDFDSFCEGFDFTDENSMELFQQYVDKLPCLTEDELEDVILSSDSQAYYQTIERVKE